VLDAATTERAMAVARYEKTIQRPSGRRLMPLPNEVPWGTNSRRKNLWSMLRQ